MTDGHRLPEARYIDIAGGHRVHHHDVGEGPPVVFVHGSGPGGAGWSNFHQNVPALAAAGFRALVPDLLGYGYSSKPDDAQYTLDFHADAVLGFLDALDLDSVALVGNSLGGAVAIRVALRAPDRVRRLVLMAPGGLEEREVYMQMRGIRSMLRAIFDPAGITRDSMRRVFSKQLHDPSLVTETLIEERYQIALTQPKAVFETSRVPNQSEQLGDLACPVLGFWGVDDQFCPVSGATTLATRCQDARVMMLSGCGHWVMVEHQDLFDRMTAEFLKEGP